MQYCHNETKYINFGISKGTRDNAKTNFEPVYCNFLIKRME